MKRTILFLAVCLLSCGQKRTVVKTKVEEAKPLRDSTTELFAGEKTSLDELFSLNKDSAEFSLQNMWTSLLIGHLFGEDNKDAVLRYMDNDTVVNVIVLRQAGKDWDTIFSTKICPATTGSWNDLIQVSDFNGDNIPDLKVVKDYWDFHSGENSDLWLYSDNHFRKVQGFDSIISAEYDTHTSLIYSYQSMGCADMAMYFGVFKIVGDKVQKIKEMKCDCCQESEDSCEIKEFGQKSYMVPYKAAYKYVPGFYAEGVKEKLEMTADK